MNKEELNRQTILLEASVKASQILISNHNFYDAVNEVIEIIGNSIPNKRVFVYEFHKDLSGNNDLASLRFEKLNGEKAKRIFDSSHQNIPLSFLPHNIIDSLLKGNTVSLEEYLLIPIFVEGSKWGYLGIESFEKEEEWSISDKNALNSIASSLGQYINRHYQSLELIMAKELAEESEIYANSLFEQSPLCIHIFNTSGIIERVNKSSEHIFSIPNDKIISKFNILTNRKSIEQGWNRFFKEASLVSKEK